jgi:hypothetical protein
MVEQEILNTLELRAEQMSKDFIELYQNLYSQTEAATELCKQSALTHYEKLNQLCDKVDENVRITSSLIHSIEEINLDMDSVQRLVIEIQQMNIILDQLEK